MAIQVEINVALELTDWVIIPDDISEDVVKSRQYALNVVRERFKDKLSDGDFNGPLVEAAKYKIICHLQRKSNESNTKPPPISP